MFHGAFLRTSVRVMFTARGADALLRCFREKQDKARARFGVPRIARKVHCLVAQVDEKSDKRSSSYKSQET